jgi:hypothetical protein
MKKGKPGDFLAKSGDKLKSCGFRVGRYRYRGTATV